jgi:hypothetical protein
MSNLPCAGQKVLCNACGSQKYTLHETRGTPEGKQLRSPQGTPCKLASLRGRQPLTEVTTAAPLATPDSRTARAVLPVAAPTEEHTPSKRSHGTGNFVNWAPRCVTVATPFTMLQGPPVLSGAYL